MRRLVTVLFMTALATACADRSGVGLKPEAPPLPQQLAQQQALIGNGAAMRPTPAERFDVAIVGGACAPKRISKEAVTACIDERPCNGFGLRTPQGRVVCACFQVMGGCDAESFCHSGTRQCTKEGEEKYPIR